MKKIITSGFSRYTLPLSVLTIFLITGRPVSAPRLTGNTSTHIVFIENSLDEALKQAAIQHKYIFIDTYATWCGPCKMLRATTFTNRRAADFYNSNFINVSIDVEKGEGPRLAEQWKIQSIPTLIILNPAGKPVLGAEGFMSADELIRFGKQALARQ